MNRFLLKKRTKQLRLWSKYEISSTLYLLDKRVIHRNNHLFSRQG